MMAGEHILKPLLEQHIDRLAQAPEQDHGGRIGEVAVDIGLDHILDVKEAAGALGRFAGLQGLLTEAYNREPGGQHETLLRTADTDIDPPLVHAEVDAGDGAYAIDK